MRTLPRLAALSFERVEFVLIDEHGGELRPVVVRVGSARNRWRDAVQFPNSLSEGGETTGDPALDAEIRERAAEELVRLEAAVLLAETRSVA